ncbi:MAG: hypothetical protein QNJ97_01530 [Myxococcota bacterium]|nr:hypothetical protein [Myxococcota bacterium]
MNTINLSTLILLTVLLFGCWDEIDHELDVPDVPDSDEASNGDTDTGTGDTDTASDTGASGQGDLPEGWGHFGAPCETDVDCEGYSDRHRCLQKNILGIINLPGGYCTACCDKAGEWCAPGIHCIGLDEVYLICAATCQSDDQCRTTDGYTCTQLPYLDASQFPYNYCLPDADHIDPVEGDEASDPKCDWPWVEG